MAPSEKRPDMITDSGFYNSERRIDNAFRNVNKTMAVDNLLKSLDRNGSISYHITTTEAEKDYLIHWLRTTDFKGLKSSAKLGMLGAGVVILGPNSNITKNLLQKT